MTLDERHWAASFPALFATSFVDYADYLAEHDPMHADVVRLAHAMGLI